MIGQKKLGKKAKKEVRMGLNSLIAQDQLLIELELQEGIKLVDRTQRKEEKEVIPGKLVKF